MKNKLRKKFKNLRKNIVNKEFKDSNICNIFINSMLYKNSNQILCYYSTINEICTENVIRKALIDNKKLALPVCEDLSGNMTFYYINDLNDVSTGAFGIKEPIVSKCVQVTDLSDSVCVVPAFTFDSKGYRLGYGKGYYDRFLEKNSLISVGLCYNDFLSDSLPCDEFDKNVNYIITEDRIIDTERRI